MERGEYNALASQALLMAAMLDRLPLEELVAAIGKDELAGPMLDPELQQLAADNLRHVGCVARALLAAKLRIQVAYNGHPQVQTLRKVGEVVGAAGLEPATLRLEGGCSIQPELRPEADSNSTPSRAPGFYPCRQRSADAHLGAVEQADGFPEIEGSAV